LQRVFEREVSGVNGSAYSWWAIFKPNVYTRCKLKCVILKPKGLRDSRSWQARLTRMPIPTPFYEDTH
jgi:hypothetical protein